MAQNYQLISESPEALVYQDAGDSKLLTVIFALVGLPFLVLGLYWVYTDLEANASIAMGLIFTGVGISFSSVPLLLLFTEADNPHRVIFDNAQGCVRLQHKEGTIGIDEAIIPYEDISGFGVRSRRSSSSSSSGSTRVRYYHQVYWQKKDGGRWDLLYYSSQQKAEEYVTWLYEQVKLSKPCTSSMMPALPPRVVHGKLRGHDWLSWKNPIDSSYIMFGAIVLGFIVVAIGAIQKWGDAGDDTWVGWLFLAFSSAIGLGLLYAMYKELVTTYGLLFTSKELQFIEVVGGVEKVKHQLLLEDIGSVTFDFDENQGGGLILVFTLQQLQDIMNREVGDFDIGEVWSKVRQMVTTPQVKLKVPAVERTHIEYYIQELLHKNGGGHVL